MSEGTRSGVNWIRANSPPTTVAKLRTASVFATPGTPSSKTVALSEQCHHELLDHVLLADDHPLNLSDGVAEELRGGLISGLARRPSGGALLDGLAKRRITHALSCYFSTSVVRTDAPNRPRFRRTPSHSRRRRPQGYGRAQTLHCAQDKSEL